MPPGDGYPPYIMRPHRTDTLDEGVSSFDQYHHLPLYKLESGCYSLGCCIQKHAKKILFVGILLLSALLVPLKSAHIEADVHKLWVQGMSPFILLLMTFQLLSSYSSLSSSSPHEFSGGLGKFQTFSAVDSFLLILELTKRKQQFMCGASAPLLTPFLIPSSPHPLFLSS